MTMTEARGACGAATAAKQTRPKMWRAMRITHKGEGEFSVSGIAALAGARPSAVLQFLRALEGAGVLRRVPPKDGGFAVGGARFAFTRDLGPKAPVVRRVYSVFDPNSGKELKRQPTRAKEAVWAK